MPRKPTGAHVINGTNRLVGVIRVSRAKGRKGDGFISPRDQRTLIQNWAALHGYVIVAWFDETDSVSGKTTDREGLNAAMDMIERGEADGLIVAKLDRFARTVQGGLTTVARLAGNEDPETGKRIGEKRFVAVREGIDSLGKMDPTGQMFFTILLALAQWQLDMLTDQWQRVNADHIERGVALNAPYGYTKPPAEERKAKTGRLIIVPAEAAIVERVFKSRAGGMSWPAIARMLNDLGSTPGNAKQWTSQRVQRMCENPTYTGEARCGKALVNPDAHDAIVSRELFDAVNALKMTAHKPSGNHSLLTGVVRCAGCGGRMHNTVTRGAYYYTCRGQYGWGTCTDRAFIAAAVVDERITERLFALAAGSLAVPRKATGELKAAIDAEAVAVADLRHFMSSREVNETRRELGDEWFEDGVRGRRSALKAARATLNEVRERHLGLSLPVTIADDWADMDDTARRALVSTIFPVVAVKRAPAGSGKNVDVDGRVRIWTATDDDIPTDLPGRGGSDNHIRPIEF